MAEFVGPAIEIGKIIAEPIKRQFSYLCCFNTNIQNLRDEAKRLDEAKKTLVRQVEEAKRKTEDIIPEVETWLDNVDNIKENYMSTIEHEIENMNSGCLVIKSRFSVSRKAMKMVEAMKKFQDHEKFKQISLPSLPASMSSIPVGQTYNLKSRKQIEEDIMKTLREKKLSMMGICGMGGVGKTTMAKNIMSRVRGEQGLFDEIVMVVVSQPVDVLRIQKEMEELLGLKLDVESAPARAHLLRVRLMNSKSMLIILDDLWEGFNLEDLGIPNHGNLKECTILLTSRSSDVFRVMNVEKIFQVEILSETEAWSLFEEKVGACVKHQSLFPTAQEVVRECKGLPIALVTVGMALKGRTNKHVWEDAVQELKCCNPQDIPNFIAHVYNPLKLSYDSLQSEHAKSIFLLCCLFPEDHEIHISKLSLYAWGLGMFGGISLQVARNKVRTLVEMLISCSLLLDGKSNGHTKMHDVVRDVGIFIGTKKGLIDPNLSGKSWPREGSNYNIGCTWISLFDAHNITLPEGSTSPNLRFLLIKGPYREREEHQLSYNFLASARKLDVLSIKNFSLKSLFQNIHLLKNIRTLILRKCSSLEDISLVGELVRLEIFYCRYCAEIQELPVEIGRLNQLKLLHISCCPKLRTIARGVISRLVSLEELTLIDSFTYWESGALGGQNAALCELNCLSSLTKLRIQIEDTSLVVEDIRLPYLGEFNITIGNFWLESYESYGRHMRLKLKREVIVGGWIHQLLRTTETLFVKGEGSSKLVPLLPEFQSLKKLGFENTKMTRFIDGRSNVTTTVFPLLECLILQGIVELEEIHYGPISSDSFNNLREITLENLPNLQYLWDEEGYGEDVGQSSHNSQHITFPKLETLILEDLPRLTYFCKGSRCTEFPLLTHMEIVDCPNLMSLVSSTENGKTCSAASNHDADDSFHLFCRLEAALGRLKKLRIQGYGSIFNELWCGQISIGFFTGLVDLTVTHIHNIKSLLSVSVATNLVNLESIDIDHCSMLEQVVLWDEEESGKDIKGQTSCIRHFIFPKLESLRVMGLPRLTSFCKGTQAIEFPLLTCMAIMRCPNLKNTVSSMGSDQKCSGAINHIDTGDSLHLFCNSKAEFGMLERLTIGEIWCNQIPIYDNNCNESPRLWCNQIPIGFFTTLKVLNIFSIGIKSLFLPSIAKNLVNLRELNIIWCSEMVKVIEGEDVERCPFSKLEVLRLTGLPKLKTFCDWRCALLFPSLRLVDIDECPEMERFSFGSLTTPKLELIRKNCKYIIDYTDLNDVLLWGNCFHLHILFGEEEEEC